MHGVGRRGWEEDVGCCNVTKLIYSIKIEYNVLFHHYLLARIPLFVNQKSNIICVMWVKPLLSRYYFHCMEV